MSQRLISQRDYTEVACVDEPGAGGACHEYQVLTASVGHDAPQEILGVVKFQKGPIMENGVNGLQNEDLLEIVADRLRCFQSYKFACNENACALTHVEKALLWLRSRTAKREARGVEGKSIV